MHSPAGLSMSAPSPPAETDAVQGSPEPVSLATLRGRVRAGTPFAALTCYDATTAGHLFAAGVDVLLVGDSAAMVLLGEPSTIHAPLEFMLTLTAAVKRGAPRAFVMGDLPFMSYQADVAEGVRNAGRMLTEGRADAVKLEVGPGDDQVLRRASDAGVPTVAHLGWRPQQSTRVRRPQIAGKTAETQHELVDQAGRFIELGASMLLVEAATAEAGQAVAELGASHNTPVIGCGAGPDCHGHVVVLQDLVGLSDWAPRFVEPTGDLATPMRQAASDWAQKVRRKQYLADGGPYRQPPES
ncbi:MAG: 3-methyl-2-oxobutanoate hydroxymethyltransferase [Planctomycetota bacterium]